MPATGIRSGAGIGGPKVTADWQWSGEWPVTTEAVLAGAWRLPAEGRVLLMFVNVSDEAIKFTFPIEPGALGLTGERVQRIVSVDGGQSSESRPFATDPAEEIALPPQSVLSWELLPAANGT